MYVKPEYILIILFIVIANYLLGFYIEKSSDKRRRQYLNISLGINLGILIFYKYWNFALSNFFDFLGLLRINYSIPFFEIALPLGLSYYIFQTIGYNLDIYRGSIKAEKKILDFSLFTLFFPKLLVGPIERAHRFLPQLKEKIYFNQNNIVKGSKRIIWGLFKKLVVADRIFIYQTAIFASSQEQSGATLALASILYTFQVYADFSGYTDIAIGTARLFGYDLMENFKQPLLAKNIGDFWRRWHISLSTWVNDYIFNPVALHHRQWGKWSIFYALLISFVVIGVWHGASWNYVVFGLLQAFALIYEFSTRKIRNQWSKKTMKAFYNPISILFTFLFITFSLIVFRSENFMDAVYFVRGIFTNSGNLFIDKPSTIIFIITGITVMMLNDLQVEYKTFKYSLLSNNNWLIQQLSYAALIIYILIAGVFDGGQFIYFAF
ncbi:MAG: MBOAT family O-acyltransferase [Ginsengibacter sp.]